MDCLVSIPGRGHHGQTDPTNVLPLEVEQPEHEIDRVYYHLVPRLK
jgi:hypothetical protein